MRFVVLIVWAICSASPVMAQSGLNPNEMVRLELRSGQVIRGKVVNPSRDTLIVSDYARVIAIPAPDIYSVATYEKHYREGAVRGAKVGAITGGVLIVAGLAFDLTHCTKSENECMGLASIVGVGATFWTIG